MLLTLSAQNRQLRAFTLEDGLPQSQVYAIVQDNKGYLWLGTQGGGLARFDGNDFKVFNEKSGLRSNYINSLFTTKGNLYIGTKQGLSIKHREKFVNIETPEVNKICQINDQVMVLTKQGLYRVNDIGSVEKLKLHPEIDNLQINDFMVF